MRAIRSFKPSSRAHSKQLENASRISYKSKIYPMTPHTTEQMTYEEFLLQYHLHLGDLTREAKHEMACRGELPGPAPLGYLNHRTGKYQTTIIVDPEKAPLVRQAFEKAAQGNYSLRVLLVELTAEGLRSRNDKRLQVAGLWHLLCNPFYAGFVRYEGKISLGQHEPLTDQKTFDQVQRQLERRRRNPMSEGPKSKRRRSNFIGQFNHETYEKALSVRENADALLLAKLRRSEMLSEPEKRRFAAYMLLISRRTPVHQNQFPAVWSSVVKEMRADSPLLSGFEVLRAKTHAKIAARVKQYDDLLAQKLNEEPSDDLRLSGMFNESGLVIDILAEMNWHIFRALRGSSFLAADDPVYLRNGLEHAKSEVAFPLSTELALVAGWDFRESLKFEDADRTKVDLINRVMMSIAERNIFYFQDSQSLAEMFNKSDYKAVTI